MKKLFILIGIFFLSVFFVFSARAENTDSSSSGREQITAAVPEVTSAFPALIHSEQPNGKMQENAAKPTPTREQLGNSRDTAESMHHMVTALHENMNEGSSEAPLTYRFAEMSVFEKEVSSAKEKGLEELQSLKNKWQEDRARYLKDVETIKDDKKKEIVKKVDANINTINSNQTAYMQKALDQMQGIMSRIIAATQNAKTQGKDTTKVEADITAAQTAIVAAQTALTTQEAKTYAPTITTDAALRNTVGSTVQTVRTDLDVVHKLVLQVRMDLIQAAQDLRAIISIEPTDEITPSIFPTSSTLPVETPVATASPTTP